MAESTPLPPTSLQVSVPNIKSMLIIFRAQIGGKQNFLKAMNVAQLCLKHRINKHQKQRIVVFVASRITASEGELSDLAKKLKRNNVAVDLVNICEDSNKEKLQKVDLISLWKVLIMKKIRCLLILKLTMNLCLWII
jgi:26S proteasome regulatory subunit N10